MMKLFFTIIILFWGIFLFNNFYKKFESKINSTNSFINKVDKKKDRLNKGLIDDN